ncbi:MAG: tRNA dimethylallyltransferase [Parcubacteria bacterium C7867-006]|nr:MAG: tRNA dimethylallyltransferase [Parcubacteria bacterium C7867-006]
MKKSSFKNNPIKPKILVILGPTATGKSDLAVKLAKKYNGEIISADSRQVYKGLDIGTGKITKKEMLGIPHYMLNVISPKKVFSVSDFQKLANAKIEEIISKGKLPIIVGGTGFYIQSIVDGIVLPEVPPNKKLRKELEKKNIDELVLMLEKIDKERLKNIDKNNPVRLIRAIEIAEKLGSVPKIKTQKSNYDFIQIGLNLPEGEIKEKIHKRLLARIKKGMMKEAEKIHKNGLSWKRMRELGLEYRYLADFLEKIIDQKELINKLDSEIYHYSKRQMTWFKKDKKIKWFNPKNLLNIEKFVNNSLINN